VEFVSYVTTCHIHQSGQGWLPDLYYEYVLFTPGDTREELSLYHITV
jgi:hypothetical protein